MIILYAIGETQTIQKNYKQLQNLGLETYACGEISPIYIYSINPPAINEDSLIAYFFCLEAIADNIDIIPIRYGMFFEDKKAIETALEKKIQYYAKTLAELKGCVEMTASVFSKMSSPPINITGSDYLRIKIEKNRQQQYYETKIADLVEGIYIHKKISFDEKRSLLNIHFLVKKTQIDIFNEKIKLSQDDMIALLSGPWVPYNFVS